MGRGSEAAWLSSGMGVSGGVLDVVAMLRTFDQDIRDLKSMLK